MSNDNEFDIAIIGMSGRYPGANNLGDFWDNLINGRSFTGNARSGSDDSISPEDSGLVTSASVLDDVDRFDASFFGYSSRDAELLDPQSRLFLECAWEAFEAAGYNPRQHSERVGVFASSSINTYFLNYVFPHLNSDRFILSGDNLRAVLGCSDDFLATRVSYKLNLTGPSFDVRSACSSSLVAVHLARQSILNGECETALAGGVSILLPQESSYRFEEGSILSPDGHCRPFDAKASGTVFGRGVGIVILKMLSAAIDDGDHIHAVIKGSSVNNDGSDKAGYSAPSITGQAGAIAEAIAEAGIQPDSIDYIEAHGTGTAKGDPIEIAGLERVFGNQRGHRCAIGSLKSNIGHLDVAAGVSGLIKTVLMLEHQTMVPTLHFNRWNEEIDYEKNGFYVNDKTIPWHSDDGPRRAGVSSFGMGGTNSHVVLEEPPPATPIERPDARTRHVLCISAKQPDALADLARRYRTFFSNSPSVSLTNVCFTANTGREHFRHRLAVIGDSAEQMASQLSAHADGTASSGMFHGALGERQEPEAAFLFTGQVVELTNAGKELLDASPVFRNHLKECDRLLRGHLDESLFELIYQDNIKLSETAYAQPAVFALEYALAQQWMSWGIRPTALLGHSLGEYVAACIANVFSLEQALRLVSERGRLMQRTTDSCGMVSVFETLEFVEGKIEKSTPLEIAAVNGRRHIVVSGDLEALGRFCRQLNEAGVATQQLKANRAFHSQHMDAVLDEFLAVTRQIDFSPPEIPLISSVTGCAATDDIVTPDYWCRQIRSTVQFSKAWNSLKEHGPHAVIEMGPAPILVGLVAADAPSQMLCLPALRPSKPDWTQCCENLAKLHVTGFAIDWNEVDSNQARRRIPLPTYPFQRKRYWIKNATPPVPTTIQPDIPTKLYEMEWAPQAGSLRQAERIPLNTAVVASDRPWLFVSSFGPSDHPLADAFLAVGAKCVFARTGSGFSKVETNEYHVDLFESDGMQLLMDRFERDYGGTPTGVIYFAGKESSNNKSISATKMKADDLSENAVDECLEVVTLARELARRWNQKVRLWIVTQGTQPVGPSMPDQAGLRQSPLWGLGRAIALEQPDIWGGLIDLGCQANAKESSLLAHSLCCDKPENDQLAIRGETLYQAQFVDRDENSERRAFSFDEKGTYLITGGFGYVGRKTVAWLHRNGARHFVLTTRSVFPKRSTWEHHTHDGRLAERLTMVRELEATGARITVVQADASCSDAMSQLLKRIKQSAQPLKGIVHAAGVVSPKTLDSVDRSSLQEAFAAKIKGGWLLHQLTRQTRLDFLIFFSTAASIWGSKYLAAHAAANHFLDTLAHFRRRLNLPALSINWARWGNGPESLERLFAESGLGVMRPDSALDAMRSLLGKNSRQATIAAVDWDRFKRIYQAKRRRTLLDKIDAPLPSLPPTEETTSFLQRLENTKPNDRSSILRSFIIDQIGEVLGTEATKDQQRPLAELGMDSLSAVSLRNRLASQLDKNNELPVTLLFDYPTIEMLSAFFAKHLSLEKVISTTDDIRRSEFEWDLKSDMDELADLSDEDAERLLAAELKRFEEGP